MDRRWFIKILLLPVTAAAGWRRDNPEECRRLDEALERIVAQRRAGYTAKQGRRLLEKRREAEQKRRELCR